MALGRRIEFEDSTENEESSVSGRPIELSTKEVSRMRSLLSALPKGLIKGGRESSFFPYTGAIPKDLAKRVLEHVLPTQDKFAENALERTGEILPQVLATKASSGFLGSVGRSLAAGAIGEGVKEAGGGELAQTAGEAAGFGLPGLGRKIIPTKSQQKLVNYARKAGMSEKQIAPLLPEKGKRSFFGKVASKGTKTQEALFDTKQGIGNAYEFVKNSPEASRHLNAQQAQDFTSKVDTISRSMPSEIRKQIVDDYQDLLRDGLSGKNLVNFYQDISSRYKVGREHLERFKQPIREALEDISPTLSEDFQLTNELFKKRLAIGKTLKPGISSELMDLGELGKLANDVMNLSVKGLSQLMGIAGARRFAREILINPRLQNITRQMAKAANENKIPIVLELARYIKKKYSDDSVEHTE